jgi:hypothetical protein
VTLTKVMSMTRRLAQSMTKRDRAPDGVYELRLTRPRA